MSATLSYLPAGCFADPVSVARHTVAPESSFSQCLAKCLDGALMALRNSECLCLAELPAPVAESNCDVVCAEGSGDLSCGSTAGAFYSAFSFNVTERIPAGAAAESEEPLSRRLWFIIIIAILAVVMFIVLLLLVHRYAIGRFVCC